MTPNNPLTPDEKAAKVVADYKALKNVPLMPELEKIITQALRDERAEGERQGRQKALDDAIQAALTVPCKWEAPTLRPSCATSQAIVEALKALKETV